MKLGHSLLASMLAVALTLAGVACACAIPAADARTAPAPHAHHQVDEISQSSECMDSGCGGNGGVATAAPERGLLFAEVQQLQWDDGLQAEMPLPDPIPPFLVTVNRTLPAGPPRAATTPVVRFDKLLN